MTRLDWDENRKFETGVDRGVLYAPEGIAWNGLVEVAERFEEDSAPYYVDGVKVLDRDLLGDFAATIRAFTYPEELEELVGGGIYGAGLVLHDQPRKTFGFSYRTKIGNDLAGADYGYKIHVVYSVTAEAEANSYASQGRTITPMLFSWAIAGTPSISAGNRPTAHVVLDSTLLLPAALEMVEDILYGTDSSAPRLPSIEELISLVIAWARITITDNGDGTWTAVGPPTHIEIIDTDTFQITGVTAEYITPDTYEVSTTEL